MIGASAAKALAVSLRRPYLAINHLEGHLLSPFFGDPQGVRPSVALVVSGGHTLLLEIEALGKYRLLGQTQDDAAGEAFDKVGKLLGLPYPGGPNVEALARTGNPRRFALPRPMLGREGADFSLSGLKTAVRQIVRGENWDEAARADLAASFQAAVLDVLIDRSAAAMARFRLEFPRANTFVVAGGVAANTAIRDALAGLCAREGFEIKIPPPGLCTDNAAMVAWAGVEHGQQGLFDALTVAPRARWPLQDAPAGGSQSPARPKSEQVSSSRTT
jgi:N6-L-threonylcarbamoyladenine synthase